MASRVAVAWALALLSPAARAADATKFPTPTAAERLDYIRRSQIWQPTDVASKDLYNGPAGELKFAIDEEITCDFVPKPMAGWTEKFLCRLADGRIFKVKYVDGPRFKEVYGEVLGTRLYWALGFYADRMLPVRVTCHGCPKHPWKYVDMRKSKRHLDADGNLRALPPEAEAGTYTFDPAAVEEKIDAEPIEQRENQGWSWRSLARVDASLGGATTAQIDALKLLNAFLENADNKFKQNSLVCPRGDIVQSTTGEVTCRRPIMYVDDLGSVFGQGGFTTGYAGRVDYDGWKKRPVWRNPGACRARLVSIGGVFRRSTLRDPRVGEEGRALLASLLAQLSDAQVADLFRAARIERLHQTIADGASGRREATVQDWVDLFKKKREEITNHPGCQPRGRARASGDFH